MTVHILCHFCFTGVHPLQVSCFEWTYWMCHYNIMVQNCCICSFQTCKSQTLIPVHVFQNHVLQECVVLLFSPAIYNWPTFSCVQVWKSYSPKHSIQHSDTHTQTHFSWLSLISHTLIYSNWKFLPWTTFPVYVCGHKKLLFVLLFVTSLPGMVDHRQSHVYIQWLVIKFCRQYIYHIIIHTELELQVCIHKLFPTGCVHTHTIGCVWLLIGTCTVTCMHSCNSCSTYTIP